MEETTQESRARASSRASFTLGFLQKMCGTLGLCFHGSEELQMDSLHQKSLYHIGIFDTSPTVRRLGLLQPLKLLCELLCEDVEQVNQIKSYDEFELIKFAKFYAFHSAKQSALLNLEDINNVEKLLHYKIREYIQKV